LIAAWLPSDFTQRAGRDETAVRPLYCLRSSLDAAYVIAPVAIDRSMIVFSLFLFVFRMTGLAPSWIFGVASLSEILLSLDGKYKFLIAFRANQDTRFMIAIHKSPSLVATLSVHP
jgi:hypothetical protein